MKVFLAGATGVVGRPLVPALIEAGHEVIGLTRSPDRARALAAAGATPVVADVFDREGIARAVGDASPDAIVDHLTDLPSRYDVRRIKRSNTANDRVRGEGTPNLLEAARAADVERFVAQSGAFFFKPEGGPMKDESAPLFDDAPADLVESVQAAQALERSVQEYPGGLVLRFGWLYGPGTWWTKSGPMAKDVKRFMFPIVGDGGGVYSWLHVDDAVTSTLAALSSDATGLLNVADDEPAATRDWLPEFAKAIGARKPHRIPSGLARLFVGSTAAMLATQMRGAANGRAREELNWTPTWSSWRRGSHAALG